MSSLIPVDFRRILWLYSLDSKYRSLNSAIPLSTIIFGLENCCEWTFHSLRDWAHVGVVLCELPTASSHFGSAGVLWVLTGTHPCGPPSRMMEVTRAPALVDCGLWSWCCHQEVLWSHREVCECECISTPLHWLPRLLNLVVSLRFALQVSLSVLQHNFSLSQFY